MTIDSDTTNAADAATKPAPIMWYVIDTTALPGGQNRTHELIVGKVKTGFVFEPGKPKALPIEIAVKFLKVESFKRTDEHGNLVPYNRQPKQPDELGAGERFKLGEGETIARFEELTNVSLLQRCLELPGGEAMSGGEMEPRERRTKMIAFIVATMEERRKANLAKEADMDRDSFLPPPEAGDDADAAEAA